MSMGFVMDVPEDVGGDSDFMTEPGAFHFLVTDVRNGKDSKGEMLSGFSVELEAITGKEKGKKVNLNLYNGELTHKDGGEMSRRKQAAFLIAADVLRVDQIGKKGVQVDLEAAKGSQICADLELGDPSEKTGKRYLRIRFANFFHIDDPRAEKIVKDAETLGIIPGSMRHKPEYFAPLLGHRGKDGHDKKTSGGKPINDEEFSDL